MLISNPLKKLQKISCEKSDQRKTDKKWSFDLYYCVQKFLAYNFFMTFCSFFNGFKLSITFCIL
jgi:hypothetical protein